MKRLALGFLLCTLCHLHADEATVGKNAKAVCTDLSMATLKGDFNKIAELTHPKLIDKMGGKAKAVKAMGDGFELMKRQGITLKKIDVGEPSKSVAAEKELYLYVPLTIEMSSSQGRLRQKTFIVGVSADQGKTWLFLNGDLDRTSVLEILPGLPDALELPKPQAPVIEK